MLFIVKVDWNVKGLQPALKIVKQSGSRMIIAGDFLDPIFHERELHRQLLKKTNS
ncbi:hypothetical protein [Desulfonatronum parangueonense]